MCESTMDEERKALRQRRQEIIRQLETLNAQDEILDANTLELRSEPLLCQIREIEQRIAEIDLDELCLRRMEGGE